jgi:hypothetical protein
MSSIGQGAQIALHPRTGRSGWAPNFDVLCQNRMLNNISEMTNLSDSTCSGTPARHSRTLFPTGMVESTAEYFAQVPFRGAQPLPYRYALHSGSGLWTRCCVSHKLSSIGPAAVSSSSQKNSLRQNMRDAMQHHVGISHVEQHSCFYYSPDTRPGSLNGDASVVQHAHRNECKC